ncbi:MAG: PAS domain S-box protein [Sandaracinaceae bacterium]|nr:PAS domain S-box protein [Sandaracinaceae bacterium]
MDQLREDLREAPFLKELLASPAAVVLLVEGRIVLANNAAARWLGRGSAETLLGQELSQPLTHTFPFEHRGWRLEAMVEGGIGQTSALLAAMPVGALVVADDGLVLAANAMLESMLGAVVGRKVEELVPPAHRSGHSALRAGFQRERGASRAMGARGALRAVRDDGVEVDVDVCLGSCTWLGAPATLVTVHDVSARVRAVEAAQRSEALLRSTFAIAGDGIFVADPMGRFVEVNPAACAMTGYGREELLRLGVRDLVPADERERLPQVIERIVSEGRVVEPRPLLRQDGSLVETELHVTALEGGGLVAVARDLSERHRADAAIMEKRRIEDATLLDASLAHDFNNVIHVIQTLIDLLRTHPLGSEAADIANDLERVTARSTELGRRIMQRGGLERGGGLELRSEVALLARLLNRTLRPTHRLDVAIESAPARLSMEPIELDQVVLNLVLNARDAMPGGGTISLRVSGEEGRTVIEVRDHGSGMDEATRARLFEPFFTTKSQRRGRGLGLTMVRRIASKLGAEILCESVPGEGTTFRFVLPR